MELLNQEKTDRQLVFKKNIITIYNTTVCEIFWQTVYIENIFIEIVRY